MTTIHAYFTLPPDWGSGVTLTRSYKTGIQMSVTGQEKRSALYSWPRRALKYKVIGMSAAEVAYIKRKIWRHQHHVWGVPLWTDGSKLTAIAAAGTKSLAVEDTRYRDFAIGDKVIITNPANPDSYEYGTIASFTQTGITLVDNLTYSWTSFYFVYPVLPARFEASMTLTSRTDRVGEMTIKAVEAFEENMTA